MAAMAQKKTEKPAAQLLPADSKAYIIDKITDGR
jgi:hypothetical protein